MALSGTSFMRRLTPRLATFGKRFKTDRSFRLATLDDLEIFHTTLKTKQSSPDAFHFVGYSGRAELFHREIKDQVLIDLSHQQGYRRGHIPGAINLPVETFDFTRHVDSFDGLHEEEVAETFLQLGVSDNASEVILYDNSGLLASRLWFVLRYYGFRNVRVLQGGWRNYLKAGLPVSEETSVLPPATTLTRKPKRTSLLTKPSQFFVDLNNKTSQIIDSRRPEAYGEYAVREAINLPSSCVMEDAKFRPMAEISAELSRRHIDGSKPCIVYSENSLSSCVVAFGLQMAGIDKVSVYDMGIDNYRRVFDDAMDSDAADHLSR